MDKSFQFYRQVEISDERNDWELSAEAVKIYRESTYADFECLDSVVQQQYIAHNLCVLPVSLQFRRPDIVGSASGQAEARAHHALTRICNKPREKEETANQMSNRGKRNMSELLHNAYT